MYKADFRQRWQPYHPLRSTTLTTGDAATSFTSSHSSDLPAGLHRAGTISGAIIQALRYLGKDHVTEETVKRLDRRL